MLNNVCVCAQVKIDPQIIFFLEWPTPSNKHMHWNNDKLKVRQSNEIINKIVCTNTQLNEQEIESLTMSKSWKFFIWNFSADFPSNIWETKSFYTRFAIQGMHVYGEWTWKKQTKQCLCQPNWLKSFFVYFIWCFWPFFSYWCKPTLSIKKNMSQLLWINWPWGVDSRQPKNQYFSTEKLFPCKKITISIDFHTLKCPIE